MEKRRMTVKEARPILEEMEYDKSLSPDTLARDALVSAEQDGIVVIDEIDKIVSSNDHRHGADASSEGVQRDFLRILTEPDYNMIRQQQELLRSEGIDLHFEDDAVDAIAQVAFEVNRTMDNIGARRLHT